MRRQLDLDACCLQKTRAEVGSRLGTALLLPLAAHGDRVITRPTRLGSPDGLVALRD